MQEDWLKRERVESGFEISQSAQENTQLYIALANENGEDSHQVGDFSTRKGLTQRPLTTSDQRSITITHQLINGTSWFIKFLIRVHFHVFKWWVGKYLSQGQWLETGKTHV